MSDDKSITERLATLEAWLKKLKDSVSTVRSENVDREKENKCMQKDLLYLREENEKLMKMNESLTEKVHSLEKRVLNCPGEVTSNKTTMSCPDTHHIIDVMERRVTNLEKDIPALQVAIPNVKRELTTVGTKVEGIDRTVNQLSGLRRALSRTLVASQDCKVNALDARVKRIEERIGDRDHSVTLVGVQARDKKLVTKKWVHLDARDDAWGVGIVGLHDARRGRVVARRDGRYGVGMFCTQSGKGGVIVGVEWDGSGRGGRDLGRTSGHGDRAGGITVLDLKDGDEVWLAAYRQEGHAMIWCDMFCWLL